MTEFGRNLFWSLLTEILILGLAVFLKDDKRKMVSVLAVGTLFAGIIAFGQSAYMYITKNVSSFSVNIFQPTISAQSAIPTLCSSFESGETRQVLSGTFVMGDIIIDGIKQYDEDGTGEGTVAYFEKESTVTAQWGASCKQGSIDDFNQVLKGEFVTGCNNTGCIKVRSVIVRSDGQQQVSCYYDPGQLPIPLEQSGNDTWCP